MRRSPSARLAGTAALLALAVLAGCADDLTAPVQPHAPLRATTPGPQVVGQFSIPIPPTSYKAEVPWTNTGIVAPRAGRYRLRVQGVVTAAANPAWPGACTGAVIAPEGLGDWGPAGRFPDRGIQQPLRVRFFTGPVSATHPGFNYTKVDEATIETEVTLAAGAAVWVTRHDFGSYVYCGEGTETGMYALSGSQVLTVTELASATLECKGPDGATTIERGQTVRCVLRSQGQFRVLTRRATATGLTLAESPGTSHAAGTEHVWEGPAVASTQVEMVAEITQGGTTEQKTLSASFTVRPRDWPRLTLSAPVVTVGLRGRMQPFPTNGVLGNARASLSAAKIAGLAITRPAGGPNTGLSFLASPLPAVDHSIYLHPALTNSPSTPPSIPQTWRNDQNGVGSGTCTSSMFNILVPFVHRHEGVTQAPNSHWGITAAFYRDNDVEQRFEELYRNGTEDALRAAVRTTFPSVHAGTHQTRQTAFDAAEYPVIDAALGCLVDNNPSDP